MKRAFGFRAVMLDLGRVTERKEYYFSLLPWLARWGYNTVHLHLTDDQRCAMVFPRRPELATPGAFTVDEMRWFLRAARRHGLTVMPEIECLGHARYITDHPRYRHLAEPGLGASSFNALCPSHPESREILLDLLRDTADIFDHPVIHVGLDEVKFGDCPRCAGKSVGKTSSGERYARHAAWVHSAVRRVGRRPAMWADHAARSPEARRSFRKDVLMFVWDYNPEFPAAKAGEMLDAGFDVVCCPATVCWLSRIVPGAANLANLRTTTARAAGLGSRKVLGVDNTIWCPWRYLPGAIDFGMAFSGHLMTAADESPRLPASFARSFYSLAGSAAASAVGAALEELSAAAFSHNATSRIVFGQDPAGNRFSREDRRLCAAAAGRLRAVLSALRKARAGVGANRERFEDVILSAESLLAVARFGASGRGRGSVPGLAGLIKRVNAAWGRDRDPADKNRLGDARHHGNDGLLAILARLAR